MPWLPVIVRPGVVTDGVGAAAESEVALPDTERLVGSLHSEIAFYRDNGWAYLPGFLSPDIAAEMLEYVEERLGKE